MKKKIEALLLRLEDMVSQAEDMADTDDEDTAARYELVAKAIQTAVDALGDGVAAWDAA